MISTLTSGSENSLYTLKFFFHDHLMEALKILGTVSVPDSSPFENLNLHINLSYIKSYRRYVTLIIEAVGRTYSHPTKVLRN